MNLSMRTWGVVAGLGLAVAGLTHAPAAQARTHVSVGIHIGVPPPPPLLFERMPPPRVGFAWTPGYWVWSAPARRHVWVRGNWVRARRGYAHRWHGGRHDYAREHDRRHHDGYRHDRRDHAWRHHGH